ncbi:MAG: hypothetical protein P4M09_19690 [Devosia sp.]|nr:hypothetical protein [Devosia sp.]
MKNTAFAICLAAALLVAIPAYADDASVNAAIDHNLGDHAIYEPAIKAFQQAVSDGNEADVAAFVRYPIVVEVNGGKQTIKSPEAFERAYAAIMTPDIVDAVKSQQYGDLFVNYQGIMFGNGQVWLNGVCLDRKCRHFVVQVITIQHTGQ